jgi:hypothetical protein
MKKIGEKILVPERDEVTGEDNFLDTFNFRYVGIHYNS